MVKFERETKFAIAAKIIVSLSFVIWETYERRYRNLANLQWTNSLFLSRDRNDV